MFNNDNQQNFVSQMPVKPYCSDDLSTGLRIRKKEKALEMMHTYWGGMIELGADTFWEAFDPEDPLASPYGNMQVNSFCHAWSCTPAWLLREYFR